MSSEKSDVKEKRSSNDLTSASPSDTGTSSSKSSNTSRSQFLGSQPHRVWEPDTTGKYVPHRPRMKVTDDASRDAGYVPEYDPYKNRSFKGPIGNFVALLHLLNGLLGMGVFSMPGGFRFSGVLIGTIATAIMAALLSYSFNLLMKTEYLLCKRKHVPYLSYGEAMRYAMEEGPDWMIRLSNESKTLTNTVMVLYQIGLLFAYMNGISFLVKTIVDEIDCDILSLRAMVCIFSIVCIMIACVPDLKSYGPFSAVSVALSLSCLVMIFYRFYTEDRAPGKRSMIGIPTKWFRFVDIMMFSMFSVGTTCSTERCMKRPQDFLGVCGLMNLSMAFMAFLYWLFGLSGYYTFGNDVKSSIVSNLSLDHWLTRSVIAMQAIALLLSFGLQALPAFDVLWNEYLLPRMTYTSSTRQHLCNYTLRVLLILFIFLITVALGDKINLVAGLIVVVNVSLLGFGFPAIMQICYLWPDNFGKRDWIYYKDLAMCVLSVAIMACGFYSIVDDALSPQSAPVTCSSKLQSANDTS